MLIPPYYDPYDDDYGDDEFGWHNFPPPGPTKDAGLDVEEAPKEELIEYPQPDHLGIQLFCTICRKNHRTNVRGDIPEDNIAPCYKCWWMFCVAKSEDKNQESPKTEPVKPPSPVKEDDAFMDELAHNWFGFGL